MSYAEMFIERSFGEHQSGMKTGGNIDWKRRIFRYCLELDLLHDDLAKILQFLTRVPKVQKARNLSPVRWALRYHVYNFHVRVSAYREKLYELL